MSKNTLFLSIAFLFTLTIFSKSANATLVIEPIVGYSFGDFSAKIIDSHPDPDQAGLAYNGTIQGISYGGRIAWMFNRFYLAGEYQAMRGQEKVKGSATSADWSNTSIFGLLGMHLGRGFRLYAGATVTDHKSVENFEATETIFTGSAMKAGISYIYGPPIAINAEYVMYKLNRYELEGESGPISDVLSKFEYSAVVVSLSFPFRFGG